MRVSRRVASAAMGCAVAVLLLVGFSARSARAVPAGTLLQGEDRLQAIQQLQMQQREMATLRATVTQRRQHPMLKGEMVSQGTLSFKRPARVRWEVATPERLIVTIDGNTLLVYHPDRREAERRDLREDFGSRAALDFLAAGISFDIAEMEKRFQVDVYRDDGQLTLWLTPRSRMVGQIIASVAITQRDGDVVPRHIVVAGQKGDRTETSLTQVVVNPTLSEATFALQLKPDVKVVDVGRAARDKGSDR